MPDSNSTPTRPESGPGRAGALLLAGVALLLGAGAASLAWQRQLRRANAALQHAQADGVEVLGRLRAARLAEARAVRQTTEPGRRQRALDALVEASRIRPGIDLRTEAAATLMTTDIRPVSTWEVGGGLPGEVILDPSLQRAAYEARDASGKQRAPARILNWGAPGDGRSVEGPGDATPLGPLRFSPDGALFLERFANDTLYLWRTDEPRPTLAIPSRPAPGGAVLSETFNDDYDFHPYGGDFVLGLPAGGLAIHRVADGAITARCEDPTVFNRVRFSPDGTRLAAIRIADPPSHRVQVFRMPGLEPAWEATLGSAPNSIAWSGTGHVLAVAADDNTVSTFDAAAGHLLSRHASSMGDVVDNAFVGGDLFVATRGSGTTLQLLNPVLGGLELAVPDIGPAMLVPSRSPDQFATASMVGVVTRWEIQRPVGRRVIPPPAPTGYDLAINNCSLDFSPDNRHAATSHGRRTLIRDLATGRSLARMDAGPSDGLEFSTVMYSADGGALFRCSVHSGLRRHPITRTPAGGVELGAASSLDPESGYLQTGRSRDRSRIALVRLRGMDSVVKILELAEGRAIARARWTIPFAYFAALSPDGSQVLVNLGGGDGTQPRGGLQVRRVSDGAVVAEPSGVVEGEAEWNTDGGTALTSNGPHESILWDTGTWRARAVLKGTLGGNTTTFALAPDGTAAVIARGDRLQWIETRTGEPVVTFESPGSPGLAAAVRFQSDGRGFAVLWRDGRLDWFQPDEVREAATRLGLGW